MSMVVRNNLSAVNTLNTLNRNHTALAKSLQTVSSGMRINSAKDDTSGYAISERMRVQIRSLNQDNQNTQNGHSMMKVAEGAVQSTVDILKTLKEKVINAANDTNTDSDRAQIQKELNQSIDQINDNANVTYNGKYLVDGSKNAKGGGNFTTLTNNSLDKSTTGGTALTKLCDRNGQSLNIQVGDSCTVSYVQDGSTYSTTFEVTSSSILSDILAEAEDIKSSTLTFATKANASVAAIEGVADPEALAQQQAALEQAVTDTAGELATAQGVQQAAQLAVDNYGLAQGALDSAFATLNSESANSTMQTTIDTVGSIMGWDSFADDYNNWKTNALGVNNNPNPSAVTSTSYKTVNGVITGTNAAFSNFQTAFGNYTNAYNALSALGSLSTLQTALQQANNDLQTAQDAYNTAVGNLKAFASPTIISDSKVGLDYFGNMQYTADGEKALTITAMYGGVDGQISGFTVSITDSKGNINKSANAKLDAWEESIRAENTRTEDNSITLQTGTKANQAIKIRLTDMRARALGLQGQDGTTLNVSTQEKANAAINVLDNALKKALDQQTTIGSIESRLGYTSTNLTTAIENVTASESTIRDADMALAMTEYTKNNILAQSSQAMLAQANQSNNQVLSLLR
jgi:flagellin